MLLLVFLLLNVAVFSGGSGGGCCVSCWHSCYCWHLCFCWNHFCCFGCHLATALACFTALIASLLLYIFHTVYYVLDERYSAKFNRELPKNNYPKKLSFTWAKFRQVFIFFKICKKRDSGFFELPF